MPHTTQTLYDSAIKELSDPVRTRLSLEFAAALAVETQTYGTQTTVLDHEARIAALEALVAGGNTDTPTVSEMTTNPPIFENGIFKGLTP